MEIAELPSSVSILSRAVNSASLSRTENLHRRTSRTSSVRGVQSASEFAGSRVAGTPTRGGNLTYRRGCRITSGDTAGWHPALQFGCAGLSRKELSNPKLHGSAALHDASRLREKVGCRGQTGGEMTS